MGSNDFLSQDNVNFKNIFPAKESFEKDYEKIANECSYINYVAKGSKGIPSNNDYMSELLKGGGKYKKELKIFENCSALQKFLYKNGYTDKEYPFYNENKKYEDKFGKLM